MFFGFFKGRFDDSIRNYPYTLVFLRFLGELFYVVLINRSKKTCYGLDNGFFVNSWKFRAGFKVNIGDFSTRITFRGVF